MKTNRTTADGRPRWRGNCGRLLAIIWLAWLCGALAAEDTNGPVLPLVRCDSWTPLYQGVEHLSGQTVAGADGNQVIHALRVDLQEPTVELFTTPADTNAQSLGGHTLGLTTSDFLRRYQLQAAINANFFATISGDAEAPAMYVYGLAVSQGTVVSPAESEAYAATLAIGSNKAPALIATNWPPEEVSGIHTAVTGNRPLVLAGENVGFIGPVHPRTALGYTQDKRYLILLTLDGRQAGYSDGATDYETAQWMLRLGAYEAINLDGGGSTTMVITDGQGGAIALNRAIDSGIPGRERICGNHLGIRARPLGAAGRTNGLAESLMITPFAGACHRLSAQGAPGGIYRIEYADSLESTNWQALATSIMSTPEGFIHIDTADASARFYRMRRLVAPGPRSE